MGFGVSRSVSFGGTGYVPLSAAGGAGGAILVYNAASYGVPQDGSKGDVPLIALIALIGAAKATIYFPPGVYGFESVHLTFPSNIRVWMARGAVFKARFAFTDLTFNGDVDFPDDIVFDQSLHTFPVIFGGLVQPRPEWWGTIGDGVTDDTLPINRTLTSGAGKRIIIPPHPAPYLITAPITPAAKTTIEGGGRGSLIKTTTVSTHLILATAPGAVLKALALQGVKGSSVLNNSAALFDFTSDGLMEDCEAFGMSGDALFATDGANRIWLFKNYVHGLTADAAMINSADIAFYSDASYCTAAFNRLMGGAQTEVGIILQLNSIKHLVIGNEIGAHYSYGIIDYDPVNKHTNSIIVLNRIEDIDGTGGGGTKGAGVYAVGTGGQIIGLNQLSNTNINTSVESLAPGAIGISNPFSPALVVGNMIWYPNWYGLLVVSAPNAIVELLGNHIFEAVKMSIYLHDASNVHIIGGSITALTAIPKTQRGIGVNVVGGGPFTGISIKGVRIRGTGNTAIDVASTNNFQVEGCNISETNGGGIRISNCDTGVVADNIVDVTTAAASPALTINGAKNTTVKGNTFKGTSTTLITVAGVNTGSVFDETNILVGMDMNNISNASAGMRFTTYGDAAPVALTHQVGDRVIKKTPVVGQPKGWQCTVAGVPGTWVAEGNL